MRLVIYDNNPGPGLGNAGLRLSWKVWAWKQLQTKESDAVFAANNWFDAVSWALKHESITWIQYWGHGSDGAVYCGDKALKPTDLALLKGKFKPDAYIWFRSCFTFKSTWGRDFARSVRKHTGVKVAGHTQLIGLTQPGLQVLSVTGDADWDDFKGKSIWCFQSKLPE